MLNVYDYYTEPSSLPLYEELSESFKWMKMLIDGVYDEEYIRAKLQPLIHIFAKSPEQSYLYAEWVLRDRFPDGEKAISGSPHYALEYALDILKNNPDWQYKSGRWPEAEPTIKTSSNKAYIYARQVLSKDPEWCKIPGHENGRWPEAEPYILRDAEASCLYAKYVLRHRWKEAEPVIREDDMEWEDYKSNFNIQE